MIHLAIETTTPNDDKHRADRQDRLIRAFYGNKDDNNDNDQDNNGLKGSGGADHQKAQEHIAKMLKRFYHKVATEKKAVVEMLGLDDNPDGQKDYKIDILAVYPRSKLDKGDDITNWTIRFGSVGVEIDTSASKRVKGHPKTGHKSKRAHIKDLVRENELRAKFGIDLIVRFEATDISQKARYEKIGEETFLQEMGITRYPYQYYHDKHKK